MNHKLKDNLKKIRKEHNLSQEQLAEELGVSRQAISKWESGTAYPEMDKILTLCNKFHLNIDDLLNKDIKEVKEEEETKNNLNKIVEDFMKFITDTINLLFNMKWKSKIKCLFEQAIIIFLLLIFVGIFYLVIGSAVSAFLYSLLPYHVYEVIQRFLEIIYVLLAITLGTIILVKVFKVRYLNYYEEWQEKKEERKEQTEKQDTKIEYKQEEKIIIRDPKDGEYRFINAIYKVMIIGIKFCALGLAVFLLFLIFLVSFALIASFTFWKSGLFFIGVAISLISAGVLLGVPIYVLFNFVTNRKSNKKTMIWTFILAVIALGVGCGTTVVAALDLKYEEVSTKIYREEFPVSDTIFFSPHVEYIEEERDNIRIEVPTCKNCKVETFIRESGMVDFVCTDKNRIETIKEFIRELNSKKVRILDTDPFYARVYASKENIEKLKKQADNYYDIIDQYEERLSSQETEIRNRDIEIEEKEELIEQQEIEIEDLKNKLSIYEED